MRVGCLQVGGAFAILAAVGIYLAFPHPIYDQARLKAIGAEALLLEPAHPVKPPAQWANIPKDQWTPAIASVHPLWVTVYPGTVMITERVYFDDSWGYFIPRDGRKPANCSNDCWEVSQGVYWFHFG